jgi:hypothetical protein
MDVLQEVGGERDPGIHATPQVAADGAEHLSAMDLQMVSNLGDTREPWQLLRMECISESETRRVLGSLDVLLRVTVVLFSVLLGLKFKEHAHDPSTFFCTWQSNVLNLVLAFFTVLASFTVLAWCLHRVYRSSEARKKWSSRRIRVLSNYTLQQTTCLLGMTCYLAANALALNPSMSCGTEAVRKAVIWLAFVRWTCLNTFFLLITVRAHDACILQPHAVNAGARALLRMSLGLPVVKFRKGQLLPVVKTGSIQTSTGNPGEESKTMAHEAAQSGAWGCQIAL